MRNRHIIATALAAAGTLLLLASCSAPDHTTAPTRQIGRAKPGFVLGGFAEVCKQGPAGTYNFTITAVGGHVGTLELGSSFTLQAGECETVWSELPNPIDDDPPVTVTVTEVNLPAGTQLDSVVGNATVPFTVADSVITFQMTSYSNASATFYNSLVPPPPPPPPACPGGSFTYTYLTATGDLRIVYDQFPAPNDNSYGTNAVGWPNGHKFSDLVGSDHAGFQLVDPAGVVRLSFNVDYISATTAAPSGYASLGVSGGDGKMLVGTADGISATTSLANNLNGVNIPGLFNAAHVQQFGSVNLLVNSPPTDPLHQTYTISDPLLAGWDFHDTYFVTITAAKLAALGFDPATWAVQPNASQLHNSPAKPCPVAPGSVTLSVSTIQVKDKQVIVTIANTGSTNAYLTGLDLTWPALRDGKLMQVKRDGDVVYDRPDIAGGSASLTLAQLVADQNKRKWDPGHSHKLVLVFERNVDPDITHYTGTAHFGDLDLTILP